MAAAAAEQRAAKRALRRAVKSALGALPAARIDAGSAAIARAAGALARVADGARVSVYLAMRQEVQTGPLLAWLFQGGKRVFVPTVVGHNAADMRMPELRGLDELAGLRESKWGIPEFAPAQLAERADGAAADAPAEDLIDVVLAPGVAFTPACQRLGHGKGHYDCFLAGLQQRRRAAGLPPAFVVGLALDEQVVEAVPLDAHDVPLDAVVTPTRVFLQRGDAAAASPASGAADADHAVAPQQ